LFQPLISSFQVITAWVAARPLDAVLDAMATARVPAGPILRPRDLVTDPQFVARGMFQAAAHAPGGRATSPVTVPALLPVMSGTPGATAWAGPDLGHHTAQVLREELGWDEEAVAAYVKSVCDK
jgi:crotonobetainyl-CoA:carnitine CoA-transferase CaiB-like acyl-CoA transferase